MLVETAYKATVRLRHLLCPRRPVRPHGLTLEISVVNVPQRHTRRGANRTLGPNANRRLLVSLPVNRLNDESHMLVETACKATVRHRHLLCPRRAGASHGPHIQMMTIKSLVSKLKKWLQ